MVSTGRPTHCHSVTFRYLFNHDPTSLPSFNFTHDHQSENALHSCKPTQAYPLRYQGAYNSTMMDGLEKKYKSVSVSDCSCAT